MLCGMGERGKMAGILIIVSRLAATQRWGMMMAHVNRASRN